MDIFLYTFWVHYFIGCFFSPTRKVLIKTIKAFFEAFEGIVFHFKFNFMFSVLIAHTAKIWLWKKPRVVQPTRVCYCASKKQDQAYRFSNSYQLSNFLDIQKQSFQTFLKEGLIQELKRQKIRIPFQGKNTKGPGLKLIFYPESYQLLEPKLTVKQAMFARKTYSSDLYVPIKIVDERNQAYILDWFCLATIPLMTANGHFIVNGLPRMIMSQIIRSPGIYFKKLFRSDNPNSAYFTADFIAQRGTWLRLETDLKPGKIWVKMKNEQKIPFMHFFQWVGMAEPVLSRYYNYVLNTRFGAPEKAINPLANAYKNEGYTEKAYDMLLKDKIRRTFFRIDASGTRFLDPSGRIKDRINKGLLTPENEGRQKRAELFFQTFSTELADQTVVPKQPLKPIPLMTNTVDWDTMLNFELEQKYPIDGESNPLFGLSENHIEELFVELKLEYKLNLRGIFREEFSHEEMKEQVDTFLKAKFFNQNTYNLSLVGRAKLNQTLGLTIPLNCTLLTEYDLLFGALYLVQCATGKKPLSDIDHLMNRKIKPVGELIQNQFAVGLKRFEEFLVEQLPRTGVKKKKNFFALWQTFSQQIAPEALVIELNKRLSAYINPKPMNTALKEFFGSNPLSQMLDQTNPLAEITHKRRLSSLGIGGVSRQNAGMDIRGIHPTHYGRICPIETPEGQNAGLVNSFTIYARVNPLGFIQTPFYEIYRGFVLREKGPVFFLANQEKGLRIAPGDLSLNAFNSLPKGILLPSRKTKLFERVDRSDLEYVGVHPLQMISIATSLIPFLEHDDGNRALMGSNMQRQAVPTLHPTLPIVGTGLETKVLLDVDHVLQAKESGFVSYVDSQKICLYSPDSQKKETKTNSHLQGMKQTLAKKITQRRQPPKLGSKQTFFTKQSTFNSICTTNGQHFWSFLSLSQFQNLYQSQLQNDRLSMMHIFEMMEKQKTYDSKRNKLVPFKNPFLLTLKHQPTLDSSQVFLNAAFFALQSFAQPAPFSLNPSVQYSRKKTVPAFSSKQQSSPFAKRIHFKKNKKRIALSPKGKKAPYQAAFQILKAFTTEFRCFFDPIQTSFQTTSEPRFFLRAKSTRFSIPRKRTVFAPLVPQTLLNVPLTAKLQKRISGQWRQKQVPFQPTFCQPGLIKVTHSSPAVGLPVGTKEARGSRFQQKSHPFSNFVQKQPCANLKRTHYKQIALHKHLFYQHQLPWLTPTSIQSKKMGYFPLTSIQPTLTQTPAFPRPLDLSWSKTPRLHLTTYSLDTIARSNQDTYLLHRAVVKPGQWVEKGDILADNSSSCNGELAIGKNLLVGYTPWEGYNFEDAVLLSDRVLSQELFSSLHVERYEVEVRDTPDGIEEITCENPSRSKKAHLDSKGIVKVGSWVSSGDILVAKQTPKDESEPDGFQLLLNAIFMPEEKPPQFRDTSLRVPPNVHGWVVHVEVVETMDDIAHLRKIKQMRETIQKEIKRETKEKKKAQPKAQPKAQTKAQTEEKTNAFFQKRTRKKEAKQTMANKKFKYKRPFLLNSLQKKQPKYFRLYYATRHGFNFSFFNPQEKPAFETQFPLRPFTKHHNQVFFDTGYSTSSFRELCTFSPNTTPELDQRVKNRVRALNFQKKVSSTRSKQKQSKRVFSKDTVDFFAKNFDQALRLLSEKKSTITQQELLFKDARPPQVPKRVNVYIAEKRMLQVGDKIAGRHGNKGIISTILPQEDMPYLPDGTPLDLVLNPLGVPSRMNVGQIFECLLGLAGSYLYQTYKIQPFDELHGCEASRSLVYSKLYEARIKTKQNWLFDPNFPGKVRLFDGRTGQCFEQPVTVGKAYILKLIHLVDEKIHARSTGPYSLVTQQPLRGRSNKGGQRVGEMEVWALEGFGAAYILQELLTVKSDDILGRQDLLKSIVSNDSIKFGTPESFRVLLRELEALCIGSPVTLKEASPLTKHFKFTIK
jgi:DNA-directed RNA polymerase subunit beta